MRLTEDALGQSVSIFVIFVIFVAARKQRGLRQCYAYDKCVPFAEARPQMKLIGPI